MLRYLRRVEDLTTGKLRWGILTNGARWRLYYQGARSVAEKFFEIELPHSSVWRAHRTTSSPYGGEGRHGLRVFILFSEV